MTASLWATLWFFAALLVAHVACAVWIYRIRKQAERALSQAHAALREMKDAERRIARDLSRQERFSRQVKP